MPQDRSALIRFFIASGGYNQSMTPAVVLQ